MCVKVLILGLGTAFIVRLVIRGKATTVQQVDK